MSDNCLMRSGIMSIGQVFEGEAVQLELPPADSADGAAAKRWERNLAAIRILQPKLEQWVKSVSVPFKWAFARDGYLTAKDGEAWFRGCSVPLLAGREMLKKLELSGSVGCFVCPSHAGEIRACFERLGANQAFVAVVSDPLTLAVMLHCDDFSAEIRGGRLLFAGGWDWAAQLDAIFESQPGLALPQTFIRTVLIDDEELNRFAAEAQAIISDLTARRTQRTTLMRQSAERTRRRSGKILVVAPGLVRVADLSGIALAATLCAESEDESISVRLDPDCPLSGSPLAVATAIAECDAIVTANTFRAGFPGLVPANRPWITWVTYGPLSILPPEDCAPGDGILLADPDWKEAARQAGWREEQIGIAGWPDRLGLFAASAQATGKSLGLLADARPVQMPDKLNEVSSHRLLWEMIDQELTLDPFVLGNDPQKFLQARMAKLGVKAEKFEFSLFFEGLILPAYWAGLTKVCANAGISVSIIGRVDSPEALAERILECAALIHPIPSRQAHPVNVLGRPVVQPAGMNLSQFIFAAKQALAAGAIEKRRTIPPLSLGRVVSLIPGMRWAEEAGAFENCSD
jgi:hypothetical protein